MSNTIKNLFNLEDLSDFKVAEGYSDIRGLYVKDANNRTIGKVYHLLVDKAAMRVGYLGVEADKSIIEDRHDTYQNPVSEGLHEFINKDLE